MKALLYRLVLFPLGLLRGPGLFGRIQRAWRIFGKSGWAGVQWELGRRMGGYNNYDNWVRKHDTLTPELREKLARRVEAMVGGPLISVVMPTYNPNPAWLREAIESVRAQIYPNWELCIADDASTSKDVREILEAYSCSDARVKVVFRPQNGHISASSNSAIELATGSWLALMDHDDLLPAHALYCVAECIVANPDVRLIYSDEDKVDEGGHRFGPYFKPDWNVDLFRSQNMFSHLGVLATDLVREVGGFRVGLEGSQDWDLVLRCMERVDQRQIRHIPRVLYHWRVHGESTAKSMGAKPYAAVAGERALNDHLARTGVQGAAEYLGFGFRVRYALPQVLPLVSLIIPTRNALQLVRQCIESIEGKTSYANHEIILVDNGSDDPSALAYFKELGTRANIRVLRDDRPFNYAALNNAAVAQAKGELVALVNNDIEVITPDWLSEMVSIALQPGVGAVGARLWYPNMTLQHAGVILGVGGIAAHAHRGMPAGREGYGGRAGLIQSFSAVTAACLVMRKSIYEQVGGFDEVNLQVAFNDVDFCLRLSEAGYRNVWTPYAELMHHESATRGKDLSPEKRARFEREVAYMHRRWDHVLQNDPAYSPNLMLAREDFSYAWPPRLAPL
ncbi:MULTISPECIES: glycosyltransferase family 2 protein [unclassified Variovorax]|uniref:glycosyltransferase family 2 protein n=1 Tax=unclassified Variovorax TaxID=663243 RepID=UPI00076DE1C3|nr:MULTISPECIES: glycosyltransferase family 2 protein [unclassified Variovorax]KWT82710.1 Glycosyl transferase, group 2 family protein [Variovorax sp. WDL1]PNG59512.1 Chondroitin synthase [Variovorax sp. B4]PNG60697.1 Chondroitin synthase [Variovorax sp. B2]VTV13402.1 Chondroitin polymerase [Variovorax sp. WDL1]